MSGWKGFLVNQMVERQRMAYLAPDFFSKAFRSESNSVFVVTLV